VETGAADLVAVAIRNACSDSALGKRPQHCRHFRSTPRTTVYETLPPALRLLPVAALIVLLVACGGEGEQAASSEGNGTAHADTIAVTMTDYAYQPDEVTVPAGQEVTLQFTNEGTVEHYFVVGTSVTDNGDGFGTNLFQGVSIEKNKQTESEEEEEEPEEEEEHHGNEFELPPGGSGSLTFTLPASKTGTYTIACFETTGGQTHYDRGMTGTLTVTAAQE